MAAVTFGSLPAVPFRDANEASWRKTMKSEKPKCDLIWTKLSVSFPSSSVVEKSCSIPCSQRKIQLGYGGEIRVFCGLFALGGLGRFRQSRHLQEWKLLVKERKPICPLFEILASCPRKFADRTFLARFVLRPVERNLRDADQEAHERDSLMWSNGEITQILPAHKDIA